MEQVILRDGKDRLARFFSQMFFIIYQQASFRFYYIHLGSTDLNTAMVLLVKSDTDKQFSFHTFALQKLS
jgi:hypothetical protein